MSRQDDVNDKERDDSDHLALPRGNLVRAGDAGQFVSRGRGAHPDRVMPLYDLIFVVEGVLHIQEEARRFEVAPGQSLLLWQGRRHWGTRPYLPEQSFYWLHFTRPDADQSPQEAGLSVPQYQTVSRPDRLTELFRQYLEDQETARLTPLTADLTAMRILAEVADPLPPPSQDSANSHAVRAAAFIRTHYSVRLSASVVAREVDCHPDYLNRVFRQAYGHTLTDAIHRSRLAQARRLLLGSDMSVEEIARYCGFEDAGYFRRLFKRYEAHAPLEYRRRFARAYVNTE